jgi:hypothetical protein
LECGASQQFHALESLHLYNRERLKWSVENQTPDEIYCATTAGEPLAMSA